MSASGNGSTINALFYRRRYRGDIPLVKNNSGEAGNVVYTDLLFGGGTGTPTLLPPLLSNTAVFYSPSITGGAITLQPGLFTNTQSFFAPAVSQNVNVGLFTNTNAFYSATVVNVGGAQTLSPGLFTNTNIFYAANVFDPAAVVSSIRFDISTGRLVKIINDYVCISL
jgi:hypothetical protein